jgi:hypothetical protein
MVGASLLAKAVGQSLKPRLADCIREQARSHILIQPGHNPCEH